MSTPTVIQACAALYGVVPGASFVSTINTELSSVFKGDEKALLNHYFELVFVVNNGNTSAQVAARIVANLGLTGDEAASETTRMAAVLEATPVKERGGKVKDLIDAFELLTTPAATAFKTAKAAVVTAVADPTYQGIPGKNVVFSSLSVAQIQLGTDSAINTVLLTTGVDTVPGTTGSDVITGTVASLGGTLQATDVIDGAAGTDRLSLKMDVAFTGFSTGSVKNVEVIDLTNNGATGRNFDATGITGAKTFSLNGTTGGLTLTSLPTGLETISLTGQTAAFTSAYTSGAAEQSSSTTALKLNLAGVGTSTTRTTVTLEDVNALTINASGANFISVGGDDASSLVITGDGTLNATVATASVVRSVDGSSATGALTLDLTGVTPATSSAGITSVKTGSGADAITLATEDIRANATVDSGSGADTLTITNGGTTASVAYTLTGVETVAIGSATAALTFAANGWTDISAMSVKGGSSSNTAAAVTVAGLGAKAMTLNMLGDVATAADISLDNSGAAVVNFKADTAAEIAGTSVATPDSDITFGSAGSITANVEAHVAPTTNVTLTATAATSVTLNVADGKNSAGAQQTAFYGDISAPAATSVSINSTGILGAATGDRVNLSAAKATSLTVVNGASGGFLTMADPSKLTSLSVTSGAAFDLGLTAAAAKVQNLTLVANKGAITVSTTDDFAAVNSVTVSGSGTGSGVSLGTLGATANGYDLSVAASGTLPGTASTYGFSAEAIAVAKGKNVSLDFASVTGAINLSTIGEDATITSTTNEAGNVTINAPLAGTSSASYTGKGLTVSNITASGTVAVTASKAKAVSIGNVTGDSVTVDISGVETADYTLGAISAKSSATISLSPLATADTINISGQAASTGLAVTVNGGIDVETLNVTGTGASLTSLTVAGDLGAGTDVVTVDGRGSKAKAISIASLVNYDTARITGSTGADTITGSTGKDTIIGGTGQDVLTGGAGVDLFIFNTGDSLYSAPDRITDLSSTDIIAFGDNDNATTLITSAQNTPTTLTVATTANAGAGAGGINGAGGTIAISAFGVATFTGTSTGYDTLAKKAGILSELLTGRDDTVFFADSGTTYIFISDGVTTTTNDVVVALTGVALPSAAPTVGSVTADTTTGLTGIAA